MKRIVFCLALGLAPASVMAQSAAVQTARAQWVSVTANVTKAAEQVPESLYAFRPVPTVRTFGQLIAHIAGSQAMFCAIALGETPPAEDAVETTKTKKADLVAALKASTTYCEKAYAQTDAAAAQNVSLFGQNVTRLYTVLSNAIHNGEHYGNIVTYMRIKGLVPPSSAQ